MNKKEKYIELLNTKLDGSSVSIITLKFNDHLTNDLNGRYFVYDAEHINTPHAKLLKEGKTWGTPSVSFEIEIPKSGREICFKAIGLETARYVEYTTTILSYKQTVWLIAPEEFQYSA
jgi:hypothetical protein